MTFDTTEDSEAVQIDRRTLLRGLGATTAVGLAGTPAFTGLARAADSLETCVPLDIVCAIDTSGSLNDSEVQTLEDGVNQFIDALPTDGSVQVGTLEFGTESGGRGILGVTGVTNLNTLRNPSGFDVDLPDSTNLAAGTPIPAALDIADQQVRNDPTARADAKKLIVLFTDGGPNYSPTATYTAGGYSAGTFGQGTADSTVTEGEMDETASVAIGIKNGGTQIATAFVSEDKRQAMSSDAISTYTDLPTYLEGNIASSSDFAVDIIGPGSVEGAVDDLIDALAGLCCKECEDVYAKFEWMESDDEDDDSDGGCAGEFVVLDADDNETTAPSGLELISVSCDEDGEPQEACFETTLCELEYTVKAGQETETVTKQFEDTGGEFCVTGIEDTNPAGKSVTYAISNIVFTCP